MVGLSRGQVTKRRFIIGARWALGLAILALLLTRFDFGAVLGAVRHANLVLVVPAIVGLVAMHLVGAATWRLLSGRTAGIPISWRDASRTYYVAQGIGGLTPGNIGADAYRVYEARDSAGWRRALLPVVVQRVTSSIALALIATIALATLPRPGEIAALVAGAALLLALVSSALVLVVWRPGWVGWPAKRTGDPLGWSILARASIRNVMSSAWLGIALGAVFHLGSIALSYVLVTAVAPVRDPLPVIGCIAVARLSILVPVSPSGLGFQEGALSLLFLRIGLPAETALAAALLNRVALLVTSCLGAVLLLTKPRIAEGDPVAVHAANARAASPRALRPIGGGHTDGAR